MKANDGVDVEVNAIFASIVEEDATLRKAVVTGKKRPTESASKTPATESASKTPATEKKAKLISPAGQKTGPSTSDNALQAHTKAKLSATKFQRPPGPLPSSMLGFEALTGGLDDFGFEDYVNVPQDSETLRPADMHHGMEVRLGLSKGPVFPGHN